MKSPRASSFARHVRIPGSRDVSAGPPVGLAAVLLAPLMAVLIAAPPALAQDRFGEAVGIAGAGEVLVLKPAFGRGPATLYVFAPDGEGSWTLREELWSEGTAERGESFGSSLATVDGGVLVASGDPELRYGAYGFARSPGGGWTEAAPIPFREDSEAGAAAAVSLETVMRILQPPTRRVAGGGDLVLVGAQRPNGRGMVVQVVARQPDGSWSSDGQLLPPAPEGTEAFGAALALAGEVAAVGSPRSGRSGAVHVYRRTAPGEWSHETTLTADLGVGRRIGSSLALTDEGEVLAGAPTAERSEGRVVHFTPAADGAWRSTVLAPADPAAGLAFGAALAAAGDELWVGAPGAEEARGRVYRFRRDGPATPWRPVGTVEPVSPEPRSAFGASLALTGELAVVGAPGAEGGGGLAAVYERRGMGWSDAAPLRGVRDLPAVTGGEVRCEEGRAAGFDCDAVDLEAYLPLAAIGGAPGERVSDTWGWTDPETGREYALIGRTGGAAIVDVTSPADPVYLGYIPANPSGARDLKVYADHLFFTGDGAGAHGLVVFDLERLRDLPAGPTALEPDARFDEIGSAHNLVIDPEAGFAYTVSTSGSGHTCGGGLVMIDIRDPLAPSFAGCYTDTEGLLFPGRTHDAQCTIYRGPDEAYRGRELCFAANETALRIVDVSDKSSPTPISAAAYPGVAYIHQGWLTEDHRYFYLNDELDELVGTAPRTRTLIWDVTDLEDPVVVGELLGPNGSTDHNLYVKGDRMYQANYQAGLRVIDIADPENPREVGHFDTTPYGADPPGFNGAWTAFPFFESGTVLVTSMYEGVFLLSPRREELVP